jgi:hypothetical protein
LKNNEAGPQKESWGRASGAMNAIVVRSIIPIVTNMASNFVGLSLHGIKVREILRVCLRV